MEPLKQEFLDLSDKFFARFTSRLEGLTDEEYFWEPAPDCWSLVPDAEGKLNMQWGLVFDEGHPVTTIAWRYTHVIDLLCEERCATWVGLEPEPKNLFADGAPRTAQAARELLDLAFARWKRYISAIDIEHVFDKIGPVGRRMADATRATFVLHILDEVIHHGAEIGVLRDIYRAARAHDPVMSALLHGEDIGEKELAGIRERHPDLVREAAALTYWDAIPRLLSLGFAPALEGRSALHHAAANGRIELMELLIDAGAPTDARDAMFHATPVEWAEFMGQPKAAEFLKQRN